MKPWIIRLLISLALVATIAGCLERGATKASRYAPTGLPPVMPTGDFAAYIAGARGHAVAVNNAAGTPIAYDEVAAVGPFEIRPNPKGRDCRSRSLSTSIEPDHENFRYDRAVLLIHGLNDTPFSMWDLGHRFAERCYLVRGILLPGHGTVPGDLLNIGLPEWREAVRRAVWSFRGEADRLVIAGFDLGANLALDAAASLDMPEELELNGLVLLGPAFDYELPAFAPAAVGPGGKALWGDLRGSQDALRYRSIARPGASATASLGDELFARDAPRHLPLFMVASAEDAVGDPVRARAWFCRQSVTPRHLLWYSRYPDAPFPACSCTTARRDPAREELSRCVTIRSSSCTPPPSGKGVLERASDSSACGANPFKTGFADTGGAVLDLAHIAMLAAPENPRYGARAKELDCLHYAGRPDQPEAKACRGQAEAAALPHLRYGEARDDNLRNYVLRRATYNPDFDRMSRRIIDFLEQSN